MSDFISRNALVEFCLNTKDRTIDANDIMRFPSAEPEIIPIEEVSNQLGCVTIQSALYWFEFLKTLDSLGFAIVRKKTR